MPFLFYTGGRYTSSKDKKSVYAIVLFWPERTVVNLGATVVSSQTTITLLGYDLEEIEVSYQYVHKPIILINY